MWLTRLNKSVARGTSTLPKHLLPFPCNYDFHWRKTIVDACAKHLNHIFQALDLRWQYRPSLATGVGFAKGNVWSRAARRKQQQQQQRSTSTSANKDHNMSDDDDDDKEPALVFKVHLHREGQGSVQVDVRWMQGRDSVLFESFCGMLKRRLDEI